MPTYGKVKVNTLTYDASGSAVDLAVSGIAPKADPTFTGTITGATAVLTGNFTVDTNTLHVDATNNKVGIGLTSPTTQLEVLGSVWTKRNTNDSYAEQFRGRKDRAGSIVQDNDAILTLLAQGYDGSDYRDVAKIGYEIDGTPGSQDMPGRLIFSTTSDGANSSTEALRLDSSQNATFAGTLAANGFTGQLKEAVVVTAGKLSDNTDLNIESGNVFLFTTAESTTSTPNLRYNGSTTLDSKMAVGDCLSVTIITTANASAYSAQLTIDNAAVTEVWTGGSAPSGGGSSGKDIHAYTIIKVASSGTLANDYTVIANHTKTS